MKEKVSYTRPHIAPNQPLDPNLTPSPLNGLVKKFKFYNPHSSAAS